jgi:NADPH2:quinone reductase
VPAVGVNPLCLLFFMGKYNAYLLGPVNPHDEKVRNKGRFSTGEPAILANDVVGEIVKLGTGEVVSAVNIGEHIFAQSSISPEGGFGFSSVAGGLQQYALVDVRHAATVAESSLTDDEAATFPVNIIPPFIALFESSNLGFPPPFSPEAQSFDYASKTLLIVGGASNCGRFGIQLAKIAGIGRIITVAAKRNEEGLKALGATDVIDRHADDVAGLVRRIVGDDLGYALDTINEGHDQYVGVAALSNSKRGKLMTLIPPEGELDPAKIGLKKFGYDWNLTFGASSIYSEITVEFWKVLPSWIRRGLLKPANFEVIKWLDADKVNEALDRYRDSKPTVKGNVHP